VEEKWNCVGVWELKGVEREREKKKRLKIERVCLETEKKSIKWNDVLGDKKAAFNFGLPGSECDI